MALPTEPIGSIPRPQSLLTGLADHAAGRIDRDALDALFDEAVRDTIARLEALGSPVVTDGEQSKPSFVTYPLQDLDNLAPDGVTIPFADGHVRQLPRLTHGPFRYGARAEGYLRAAQRYATVPVKQAVIAPSALSLLYPAGGIEGYAHDDFLDDLIGEAELDIRGALLAGAHSVQLDFTEARLSLKLDPSRELLHALIALNNEALERFSPVERGRIGVHTCPGGDQDSTHSLDVDYIELLPSLFTLNAGAFYIQLASEPEPDRVLSVIAKHSHPDQIIYIGVTDPISPVIETPQQVRDRILRATEHIDPERLGTCDDCGFAPFGDDVSTSRDTAWAKIAARVEGTALASEQLGV
ncbi:5-methyltetrahydropteroyltriglutamate--homocysteine methyltransferase [Allocatelliglobosispora scoriae]|uniref:5-methyltetrahydropteroyltriglutamate--homocysteine methyltransferase n=1 Tax=Allocatelliglobosispora scoriae TaxID=643052 RepID=A0A841BS32_9ACTN|nr:cobalamin-independent methionine synthase II family protein [Allocatelliglobosispora scoriae]MBB5871857.1 5-methyltetrahydropteroyltriglutamate--homocysteine methyltransferase [Allocatelliglobosispora scoriae]